jgi:hypothetical protein
MARPLKHTDPQHHEKHLVLDLSDVYTWSFPEFLPFCRHLFDFSSFKAFTRITRA